ncbi:MAG: pilus assembly protein N-terminal domain-containing protein [Negativicutes bacterium]|nr:pilus assembly protein N-terminal domain-containing protein [Negativicutes bacterium]
MTNNRMWSMILLMIFCLTMPLTAAAADKLTVAVNQSQILTVAGVERVAVANPEIADVIVVSGSELLVVGKTPGTTTLHIWAGVNRISYEVEVGTNDTQIANDIKGILGYADVRVSKVGKNVILEGCVNDQYQRMRAEKVASAYGEKVINLLEITRPVQVKIEARIIEINKQKTDNLGIKWGNDPVTPGAFRFGQTPNSSWQTTYPNAGSGSTWNNALTDSKWFGKSWGGFGGYWDINAQLDALLKQGLAKILSQPNIITLSGEKASIVVGGEIPIPISMVNGAVSVEWKEYGIKLNIEPEVNNEGLIVSKIKAEVSDVDWSSDHMIGLSANFKIPPVTKRTAETALAMSSGQTMAIGGLIKNITTQAITKVPVLADIPILGKLFTSREFERDETELIILITPTIVDPKDYLPSMTNEMKEAAKENPWGGKQNGGKN